MPAVKDYFSKEEKQQIGEAIAAAENACSGEIRVHIEKKCPVDVLDRAVFWFENLKMKETELRNGVLIYLALDSRKFAIIGDKGINALVDEDFWNSTRDIMLTHFKDGKLIEGLVTGIQSAGEQLARHFPVSPDDINELSDEVSFS